MTNLAVTAGAWKAYAARSRFANAAAAAPGSSASVIARTTTTRVAPVANTASREIGRAHV